MFKDKSVAVIVPAYNEEKLIGRVISTMPDFVDKVIVINDGSSDRTESVVRELMKKKDNILLLNHKSNEGLGKSLIDGYLKGLKLEADIIAVMAGDAQMDPLDLPKVLDPIAEGRADYVKGNRLLSDETGQVMPRYRFFGNSILTLLTKFATGYWHLIDPQCGYTAISNKALRMIDIKQMTKGFGYNAHLLNMLNLRNCKVKDVVVRPIYGEAKSGIKSITYIPKVSWLLLKLYLRRMVRKYLIREFHPLIFFYLFSFVNIILISIPLLVRFFYMYANQGEAPRTTMTILFFSLMIGFLSFFFGMWMDMEDNKKLAVETNE
jgi:glycosyltransferase involved in cell wall biosynthesis